MKKLLILNLISVIIFSSLACGQTTSNEIIKITSINSIKIDLLKNIIANKSGVNLDDNNALANLRTHELLKLINSSNIRTLVDLKDVAKLNTDENKLRQHTTIINSKSIPIQLYIEEFIYDKLYQEISESAPRTGWFLDRINRRYVLKELEKLNSKDVGAYLSSYSDYTDIVKEIDRLISENKIDLSDRATLEIVVDYLIDSISCEELHATTNQVANNLLADNKLAHINFGLRIINRIIYYKLPKKIINNLFTLYFDNYLNSNNADCESSTNFIIKNVDADLKTKLLPILIKREKSSILILSCAFSQLYHVDPTSAINCMTGIDLSKNDKEFLEFLAKISKASTNVELMTSIALNTLKSATANSITEFCSFMMISDCSDILIACEELNKRGAWISDDVFKLALSNVKMNDKSLISLIQFLIAKEKKHAIFQVISMLASNSNYSSNALSNFLVNCIAYNYDVLDTPSIINATNIISRATINSDSVMIMKNLLNEDSKIYKHINHQYSAKIIFAHILSSCNSFGSQITEIQDVLEESMEVNNLPINQIAAIMALVSWPTNVPLNDDMVDSAINIINNNQCPVFKRWNFHSEATRIADAIYFEDNPDAKDVVFVKYNLALKIETLKFLKKHYPNDNGISKRIDYDNLLKHRKFIFMYTGLYINNYFLQKP